MVSRFGKKDEIEFQLDRNLSFQNYHKVMLYWFTPNHLIQKSQVMHEQKTDAKLHSSVSSNLKPRGPQFNPYWM